MINNIEVFSWDEMREKLQTLHKPSFIRESNILNIVYKFWESAAIITKSKQKLAIVMLDFEKAYDHVDVISYKVHWLYLVSIRGMSFFLVFLHASFHTFLSFCQFLLKPFLIAPLPSANALSFETKYYM